MVYAPEGYYAGTLHELRQTTYLEMSGGLPLSRIEKWTVDTGRMTMTFDDKASRQMLVE